MSLLKEATNLAEGAAGYTLVSYQNLVKLHDRAKGDEAVMISRLVESFITKAPPQILQQIMGLR